MEIIYPDNFLDYFEEENLNDNYYNFDEDTRFIDENFPRFPPPPPGPNPNMPPFGPPGAGASKPPMGPPPNHTPNKSGKNVKVLNTASPGSPSMKFVSDDAIRFCLYRFTYIWQNNRRSYWAYLVRVDRRSIAGWRWINYRWSYFGLDLRNIDAFECY